MRYCKNCKIKIENNLDNCPLCNSLTMETDGNYNDDFPTVKKSYLIEIINRSLLFSTIALSIVSIFVNAYVTNSVPWSIVVVIGAFYLLMVAKVLLNKQKNYALLILLQVLLVSAVVYVTDMVFGHSGWSIDYAIPFIIIGGSISISILSIIKPFRYKEYLIYLFIITLLGLVPLLFILMGWCNVIWTNGTCVIYSALVVIAMIIFTRKKLNSELKKRLHF